ncbi:MAG: multicopper oxidase domain-containing protein [Symploca sp. SIO3E6]|nr:multicopper oxidase domain-containing protein [Caldora sp. SIO3E6]
MTDPTQTPSQKSSQDSDIPKTGWSRRRLLEIGSVTVTAAALATPASAKAAEQSEPADSSSPSSTSFYEAFTQPPVVASQSQPGNTYKTASLSMRVEETQFTYRRGNQTQTVDGRSFSQMIPGPTILLDPGDLISINLHNTLEGNPRCDREMNYPRCFNSTNLHFHGLHVSPSTYCIDDQPVLSSDDVLYTLNPGEEHKWCVWLPDFHAPGTHWYHAHNHGSTALQVSNGMVGTILIREPNEELNMVAATEDKVWVLQEIVGGKDGDVYASTNIFNQGKRGAVDPFFGVKGDFLVNGKYQPTLEMRTGRMERWRFVNATATPRGLLNLRLCKATGPDDQSTFYSTEELQDMYLVAVDGISFYGKPPEPIGPNNQRQPQRTGWEFAPGNRADFLVKLEPGWYKLLKSVSQGQGRSTKIQILAYIHVQGTDVGDEIPALVPGSFEPYPYLAPITDEMLSNRDENGKICPRKFAFSRQAPAGPKSYKINEQLYSGDCVNVEVGLNTAEQWELTTKSGAFHPYHIHVNPFQIVGDKVDPNGPDDATNWRWWDVIALPKDKIITTRNHFLDYNGVYVIHCHILIHEDQGMMYNVRVKGDGTPPCHSWDGHSPPQPCPDAKVVLAQGAKVCELETLCERPVVPECGSTFRHDLTH